MSIIGHIYYICLCMYEIVGKTIYSKISRITATDPKTPFGDMVSILVTNEVIIKASIIIKYKLIRMLLANTINLIKNMVIIANGVFRNSIKMIV